MGDRVSVVDVPPAEREVQGEPHHGAGVNLQADTMVRDGAVVLDIRPAEQGAQDESRQCRICLADDDAAHDPLIAPCSCAGTMKFVHRECLDQWRAQERVPLAFSHCPQCKFQYRTELDESQRRIKMLKLTL